ncbi:MAG TPA: adenylosuccinate synthase [Pseudothermotoga sp.]|nr:adenylosuccinate synthase [Pseudothermotoga sp.]HOK84010.1 adenylosuccinate synthase [Pseudothermotoga sp.]HPP70476.1 adenylosuccinate synthase [Pseudothermotoga sp.]
MKTAVVGLQWGDEGKGKIVTYLSRNYDCVVRYSGGSNAGHTVDYGDFKIVHHLLPSADLKKQKMMYIGPGVVVDLDVLTEEIEQIDQLLPHARSLLRISRQAHVVLPIYKMLDEKIDGSRLSAIGTTRRGIGLSYANRALRCGLRLQDLENPSRAKNFIEELAGIWQIKIDAQEILHELLAKYESIQDLLIDSTNAVRNLKDKDLLFEGTQGVLLDVDVGTYPYVTSTNCSSTGIQSGFAYPVKLDQILGVMKAYTTRVGEGPFPTELTGEEGEKLRRLGGEYGATTGRPRRCGWLDLVLLRYVLELSGCTSLILTKADILSGYEKIPVCVAYKIRGRVIDKLDNLEFVDQVEPVYELFDGWKSLQSVEFERFVAKIEKEIGMRFSHISTGPRVDEIIEI